MVGYASTRWNVNIPDWRYEVKVQSKCAPLFTPAHSEIDFYETETIEFVLDRTAPTIYGIPYVKLHGSADFVKHNEYSILFTEVLYCRTPYVFGLTVTLGAISYSHGSGIHVMCVGNTIRYRFDMNVINMYSDSGITDTTVELSGVRDLAGNQMAPRKFDSQWNRPVANEAPSLSQPASGVASSMQDWQVAAASAGMSSMGGSVQQQQCVVVCPNDV